MTTTALDIGKAWETGLDSWNHPSIPYVIATHDKTERDALGDKGKCLEGELAFMDIRDFQTYLNLEQIVQTFPDDPQRAVQAIGTHEIGHRFCPYDVVTLLLLTHAAKKSLNGLSKKPSDPVAAAQTVVNLYTDMCLNTNVVRQGNTDIPWAYQTLSRDKVDSAFWRVYAGSMEQRWDTKLLPEGTTLTADEQAAATQLSTLFEGDFFNRNGWKAGVREYARIIGPFLAEVGKGGGKGKGVKGEGQPQDGSSSGTGFDEVTKNLPSRLDDKTAADLAKRLAEIGSNGLPSNPAGLEEFKEIMAGFGQGDPKQASVAYYDQLSGSYDVMFATMPFGRPRVNPYRPLKWTPGMPIDSLDINSTIQSGGRPIPGVNTQRWESRRRERHGGDEEVIPHLDIYIDSSGSMPNPLTQISLPVLAGFVAAKKANRKGAEVRATNFSGKDQYSGSGFTRDLKPVFDTLTTHYNGGTVFPAAKILEGADPKQVVIITDTFLGNKEECASAISELRRRHRQNRVTVYALSPMTDEDYLRNAGAEIIRGTTTDVFKKVIGRATEVYNR